MRIGITGSWRERDRESWALSSDMSTFKTACHQIGELIARSGTEITVGSDSESTADRYVVESYLSNFRDGLSVRIVQPQKGATSFSWLYEQNSQAFVYLTSSSTKWRYT